MLAGSMLISQYERAINGYLSPIPAADRELLHFEIAYLALHFLAFKSIKARQSPNFDGN